MVAPRSPFDESDRREIAKAVVIAGLAAAVTKLVEWGLEEVRERLRKSPADPDADTRETPECK